MVVYFLLILIIVIGSILIKICVKMELKVSIRDRSLFMGGGGTGEKKGGPEILVTAKRGVLGKLFVIEEGS